MNQYCMQMLSAVLSDTLAGGRLSITDKYIQHGDTSVLLHSVAVAYYSLRLARRLRLPVRERELIRGALLHDYFMYDWHVRGHANISHAWMHPTRAFKNASKDYEVTGIEADIIKKHMFPLTLVPPICRESALVCLTDKALSIYETFRRDTYPPLRALLKNELAPGAPTSIDT